MPYFGNLNVNMQCRGMIEPGSMQLFILLADGQLG